MGRLASKVVRGTFWIAASYTFSNIVYFIRTVVLIRLLAPLDFGLMGIVRVIINMLKRFSETGIDIALVQKKEVNRTTLNTDWIMIAIRGDILFVILFAF